MKHALVRPIILSLYLCKVYISSFATGWQHVVADGCPRVPLNPIAPRYLIVEFRFRFSPSPSMIQALNTSHLVDIIRQ